MGSVTFCWGGDGIINEWGINANRRIASGGRVNAATLAALAAAVCGW